MKTLLQLASITKSFGAVRALRGVSFDLRAGEVHALLGENGAGKSTLIKIITGAHRPDGGTIEINGRQIAHLTPAMAHQLGIACIYQQPALFPDLTVAENIGIRLEETRSFVRVKWTARRGRAAELLQRIGADISPDAEVRSLSMPEQQLVEIACAIGAGARIVIMDEPTASLTQQEVSLLFAVVRELRQSGVGVIYISHRLEEIFELADRVTVLRDGETVGTRLVQARSNTGLCNPCCEGTAPPHPVPLPHGEGDLRHRLRSDRPVGVVGSPPANHPLPRGEGKGRSRSPAGSECSNPLEKELTEAELIQLMVGREVSDIYPPAESEAGDVVLSLNNLRCAAGGVTNVSLELRAGEIVGLAGLIGAGRTELARVLFGITPADEGGMLFNGKRATINSPQDAIAHGIGYVPEDRRRHGVILEMPIAHNVTMAIHRRLFPGTWIRTDTERSLTLEFINDLDVRTSDPDAAAGSLSGGNQQKIALARWLATNPKLLILDEPTQGVDVGAKSEIHKIIRRLAKEGLAVLMISSDLPEIVGMSDRIAVMRAGTIVEILPGGSDSHEVMAAALGQAG